MIPFTPFQKEVLLSKNLGKIRYKNMWGALQELGYTTKGTSTHYDVYVAKDIDEEIRQVVLLHEVGHIYYHHLDVDILEEFKKIKKTCIDLGKPFSWISQYGGPQSFLNICMDLEVNSKILTSSNLTLLNSIGSVCTPDLFNVEFFDSFRDYYEPLLAQLEEKDSKAEKNMNKVFGEKGFPQNMRDIPSSSKKSDDLEIERERKKEKEVKRDFSFEEEASPADFLTLSNSQDPVQNLFLKKDPSQEMRKFINSIIGVSLKYLPDSFRLYNKGTRRNKENIIYTSLKRKTQFTKKKLAILIDISGSMNPEELIKALSSLKESIRFLNPESKVILWNTKNCGEYSLVNLPEQYLTGGLTSIEDGLEYIIAQDFTDCLIYSDFQTRNISKLIRLSAKKNIRIYSIVVREESENSYIKRFFKNCIDVLRLEI